MRAGSRQQSYAAGGQQSFYGGAQSLAQHNHRYDSTHQFLPASRAAADKGGTDQSGTDCQKRSRGGLIGSLGGLGAFGDKVVILIQAQQKKHGKKEQEMEMADKKQKKRKPSK